MNPSLAESIGVNTNNPLISQPNSTENLFSMIDTLTRNKSITVVVVDSVSSSKIRKKYTRTFLDGKCYDARV